MGGQELFTSLVEFDAALRRLAGKSFERNHVDRSLHEAWSDRGALGPRGTRLVVTVATDESLDLSLEVPLDLSTERSSASRL